MLCLASVTASTFRGVKVCKVDCGKMGRSGRVGYPAVDADEG
jgi:hypothetical protein